VTAAREYKTLLISSVESITTITLNRPDRRNAIGPEMVNELRWALHDAVADAAVRAIVITGAGKAFCAGGDFAQMTSGADPAALPPYVSDAGVEEAGDYAALLLALHRIEKPVVAKVNGHAMGGGLGLVAACHFAVASTGAQLGTPEVDVGLFPMMIMALLSRLIPRRKLVAMMLLGERLEASAAVESGLLTSAVAPGLLDETVAKLTSSLAKKAPLAIAHGLSALAAQDDLTLDAALPMLRDRLGALLGTDDAREGLTAFLEKRAPRWQGR
jgi:enoyl-CoA hydratase/carnithine racemase